MIHFDAHSDTNDRYFGDNCYTHGTPFRRAIEEALLDPKRSRADRHSRLDLHPNDMIAARAQGMRIIYMEEFVARGVDRGDGRGRGVAGDGPTYVSFDIDCLDPAYAPGTGTPEIGGFTTREAQRMLRALAGRRHRRRRRGGSRAAFRSRRHHGAGRRHDDVRAAVPGRRAASCPLSCCVRRWRRRSPSRLQRLGAPASA